MKNMTIATHNSNFHADDVFAVAALLKVFPEATVIRTRDKEEIKNADIRVDVGGRYVSECGYFGDATITTGDPTIIGWFDHHQKNFFNEHENGIPMASFGLIWENYKHLICPNLSGEARHQIEKNLVMPIDASDCGYQLFDARGEIFPYTISKLISSFNPSWQEDKSFDEAFFEAVEFAGKILDREIKMVEGFDKAKEIVKESFLGAENFDTRVVTLRQFVPWKDELLKLSDEPIYVLFQAPTGEWRIQCVPDAIGSFGMKKALPKEWGGLPQEKLAEITQVNDVIFCHPGLFMAGAKSYKSVQRLAYQALNYESSQKLKDTQKK